MNNNCLEILGLNYKNIFKDFSIAFAMIKVFMLLQAQIIVVRRH